MEVRCLYLCNALNLVVKNDQVSREHGCVFIVDDKHLSHLIFVWHFCLKIFRELLTENYWFNTLTANYEYSRSNTDNLPLRLQMQLSQNLKKFSSFFIAFSESALNFEHFEKKKFELHSSSISEVFDSQRRVYLNA